MSFTATRCEREVLTSISGGMNRGNHSVLLAFRVFPVLFSVKQKNLCRLKAYRAFRIRCPSVFPILFLNICLLGF